MAVNNKNTLLICVCGGSGSGKTTVSKEILTKRVLIKGNTFNSLNLKWVKTDM